VQQGFSGDAPTRPGHRATHASCETGLQVQARSAGRPRYIEAVFNANDSEPYMKRALCLAVLLSTTAALLSACIVVPPREGPPPRYHYYHDRY
jgi:hypothetical protein